MRKFVLFFVAAIALASCTEEIQRNEQALVGLKNGVNWRANGGQAILHSSGNIEISGGYKFENLSIILPSKNPGTYVIGNSNVRKVVFTDNTGGLNRVFSTSVGRGDGEVVIQEYNETTNTITGKFKFNAIDESLTTGVLPDSIHVINFTHGHFYKLPVIAGE